MSTTGALRKADDGYQGYIADLAFDADITLTPNGNKSADKHPDYIVNGKSPRGRAIAIGAAWSRVSQAKKPYLSLQLSFAGNVVRVNALPLNGKDMDELELRPFAGSE